ncbi:catechol 1,2-dioxygenase [Novosphingobium endophyticum]|uniref:Catechol 1,2-dioxygenase n=1 Tax=Novosphingobium endophyticum TaxID=1955250 RepID=A0A916X780_9SPHN|nr:dioxygenase [Novosphingobium endophyticum]GGC12047.1 catechol 1,2-dioxygenase [Novosphingobium endophyticum]
MTGMDEQARLNAIWQRIVSDMKQVVRDFSITQRELHTAGDYLNRLGQSSMCRSLIDVALAMTSVDATGGSSRGTRQNLEGPYHRAHPHRADGVLCEGGAPAGMPSLLMTGRVRDVETGEPLPGARLDFWQADSNGTYDRAGNHLRGIVTTDADGRYVVHTVLPNDYSEHDNDPIGELFRAMGKHNTRAAHIHLKASIDGRVLLTTQIFMPTSDFLKTDYVEGAVSDDLIVALEVDGDGYRGQFDIVLDRRGASA